MNKWREVWYTWDGKKNVSGATKVMNSFGCVRSNMDVDRPLGYYKVDAHIKIYTLGEHRRRCEGCGGRGVLPEPIQTGDFTSIFCYKCNGTGWEYKKFNN